ncbi:hypothetical protein N7520_005729 [Penicillium odoratum]|uniref:uncharacterized protein n=1 Tax=Penicillium odoratum TaxID=1167516 RepID=UPI00254873F7|nr:uncharacterized protein N7520_005729 [Penicillium odoratum]KAJ5758573.1 hypothetical protein N7520_005729 [Penicillium odoratum]
MDSSTLSIPKAAMDPTTLPDEKPAPENTTDHLTTPKQNPALEEIKFGPILDDLKRLDSAAAADPDAMTGTPEKIAAFRATCTKHYADIIKALEMQLDVTKQAQRYTDEVKKNAPIELKEFLDPHTPNEEAADNLESIASYIKPIANHLSGVKKNNMMLPILKKQLERMQAAKSKQSFEKMIPVLVDLIKQNEHLMNDLTQLLFDFVGARMALEERVAKNTVAVGDKELNIDTLKI